MLILAPSALCVSLQNTVAVNDCTCDHNDGQPCPMHHPAPKSKSPCSCRSTTNPDGAAIASLIGPIAIVPASVSFSPFTAGTDAVRRLVASPIESLAVPDAPPPRA